MGIGFFPTFSNVCNWAQSPKKAFTGVTAFWPSPRFGHPHSQIPSVLGIPFSYYCRVFGIPRSPSRDAQIPSVLIIPSQKNAGFRGKIENVLEMASAKYRISSILKRRLIRKALQSKKTKSAKICQKVLVWLKIRVFVLRGQGEGWHSASTTCYHPGRESEGLRSVPLCSFLWTRRPR